MSVRNGQNSAKLTIGGDLVVSRLGYGAMHLTGHGMWGPPEDEDGAVRVLRRAVELGVNFIDTADSYGPGDNERIIRKALHPYADDVVICTKGGMLRTGPKDWLREEGEPYIMPLGRPAYLRQQVELSLRNLGLERIDIYELHSIDPLVPLEDQIGELRRMQDEGKIRHIGISGQPGVTIAQLEAARQVADIVLVENLFNIADQSGAAVLDYCEQRGIAFAPWFPMGHGELADPAGAFAATAARYDLSPSQLALAWLLHRSSVMVPIPGTRSVEHLEQNLVARTVNLTEADWAEVEKDCENLAVWTPGA
ncbi:Predicted oxidoreductase [Amycolatopsis pretoriensis]|uniref:Predicted oxidoreductase n=1 Tax=Amycolatopsis pretoriensis TaxID=218821 RepID=A0A1H5QQN4_9PSEU|nr:aldo/keto reductase [Amycolatopsis pretoriensis]SEF27678.1 Predicted oxidoreductase [Amycolatopsis pretoriensis]